MIFFSKNLKLLRERKGIRQVDIAELIKVKPNTISNYEKGTTEPDFKSLKVMVELFNISADAMLYTDLSLNESIEPANNSYTTKDNDISIFLKLISDKDIVIASQAKTIGKLEGKVEYLEDEIKKRRENDAKSAHTRKVANVG